MPSIGLLGICYDEKSSFRRGPAKGPDTIREVLTNGSSNRYAENGTDPFQYITDEGDIHPKDYPGIEDQVLTRLERHDKWIILGGDHSITFPVIKALHGRGEPFDIFHIDAHSDLYDEFEGDRYSHACPFSRIMENGLCKRLIQLGIRTLTPEQRAQVNKWNVECIEMKNLGSFKNITFTRPVYISLDLDAFDPAYAPGVSHVEPGGLNPRSILEIIQELRIPVIGADIVELNPDTDHGQITAYLAAKLLKEIASKMIEYT